jgi:hypothetical protein
LAKEPGAYLPENGTLGVIRIAPAGFCLEELNSVPVDQRHTASNGWTTQIVKSQLAGKVAQVPQVSNESRSTGTFSHPLIYHGLTTCSFGVL